MDQVLSELIRNWGTFGLIVVVIGFIIWENFIKKDSNQEKNHQSHDDLHDRTDDGAGHPFRDAQRSGGGHPVLSCA